MKAFDLSGLGLGGGLGGLGERESLVSEAAAARDRDRDSASGGWKLSDSSFDLERVKGSIGLSGS